MRTTRAVLAVLLAAPSLALAQAWQGYSYPEAGFAVQFPAAPTVIKGTYRTGAGMIAPATTYTVTQDSVAYSVTVADLTKLTLDDDAAIEDGVKALAARGEITVDVSERINRQYGHEVGINGKDGSRTAASVFAFNHRLYLLLGVAAPPNAAGGSGKLSRFQQSLQFPNR